MHKGKHVYFFIFFAALVFLLRVALFARDFGGVEHDSGWYMGVARNLAQRGIYASYTNTVTYDKKGSFPSLHGRFSVQDSNGFTYFPAGVTVGPGYVIPEALVMKIFGYGFWAIRLWPLIAFFGMLLLLFYFAYRLGGWLAFLLLSVWLWIFPQIYISGAYEAYGEHISLFYLLLSFYIFLRKRHAGRNYLLMFASGIAFSLAVLTKYLTLLAGAPFGIIFLYDIFLGLRKGIKKEVILSWFFWAAGFVLPVAMFEAYRFVSLVSRFGIEGWQATNKDFELHFKANGSGTSLSNLDTEFLRKKFLIWGKVGFKYALLPWGLLAIYLSGVLRAPKKMEIILFTLLFASVISGLLWFVILSPTGWTRHAWLSLVLGLVLIFGLAGKLFQSLYGKKKFAFLIFVFLFMALSYSKKFSYPQFTFNESVIEEWESGRYEGGLQGLPTNTIPSLKDQEELQKYFSENVSSKDRVYYLGWFLVAEASPLVDKVFYTYDRYEYLGRKNPDGGLSYLIIGPYQKGRLSIVSPAYYINKVDDLCRRTLVNNYSYTLCVLRDDVTYTNKAYE